MISANAIAGIWVASEGFPAVALEQGQHGTTIVDLIVPPDGKPTGCEVSRSSQSVDLDAATCAWMMRKTKFKPASPDSPETNMRKLKMTIQWIIPRARPTAADLPLGDNELRIIDMSQTRKDFPPKPASLPARPLKQLVSPINGLKYPARARHFEETGVTSVAVEVDADGNPQKCNLIRPSGSPTLDEAVCPHLLKQMHYEPTISINGQFIADVDLVSINWAFAK